MILRSAYVGANYINRRIFEQRTVYPRKLVDGDILVNWDALAACGDAPEDGLTEKAHRLLKVGYNRERLADALGLLRDVPWSTMSVEQAHGSMACIHRSHPLLPRPVLPHRTMVHQVRALFQELRDAKRASTLLATSQK